MMVKTKGVALNNCDRKKLPDTAKTVRSLMPAGLEAWAKKKKRYPADMEQSCFPPTGEGQRRRAGTRSAWHTEDQELLSCAIHYHGSPKLWLVIKPEDAEKFKDLCKAQYPDEFKKCRQFLRHKTIMLSSKLLQQHNIQVYSTPQEAGDIMITWPSALHCVYNLGPNIMESINNGIKEWLVAGIGAKPCVCRESTTPLGLTRCLDAKAQKWKNCRFFDGGRRISFLGRNLANRFQNI